MLSVKTYSWTISSRTSILKFVEF